MIQALVLFLALCYTTNAYAGQAVSQLNGKVDFSYGSMESESGRNLAGSVTMPVARNVGLQLDGQYTRVDTVDFHGIGGHLFWRDWDLGLVGLTAAALDGDYQDTTQLGAEGEYYLGPLTLGLRGGWTHLEYDQTAPFIDTDVSKAYLLADLGWYPLDDLLFSLAAGTMLDNNLLRGEVEYQTPVRGLSLYAEVMDAENRYDHALFGIRWYFGADKSLRRRHREDDPASSVAPVLAAVGSYGAEYNANKRRFVEGLRPLISEPILISWEGLENYGLSLAQVVPEGDWYSEDSYGLQMTNVTIPAERNTIDWEGSSSGSISTISLAPGDFSSGDGAIEAAGGDYPYLP